MSKIVALCVLALAVCASADPIKNAEKYKELVDSRVVGGVNAAIGAAPYQVSLRTNQGHFCGGVIISSTWVLTAAHCLDGQTPSNLLVVVGTNTLNAGGVGYRARQLYIHNLFNYQQLHNDIGLIQLSSPIQFTNVVKAIPMASFDTPANTRVTLTGWGYLSAGGQIPNYLQTVDLFTISYQQCAQSLNHLHPIATSQICTFISVGKGACNGDSGGPLVANGQLVGLVSWGQPCARGLPDVFTKVYAYRDWIRYYTGF